MSASCCAVRGSHFSYFIVNCNCICVVVCSFVVCVIVDVLYVQCAVESPIVDSPK